MTVTIDEHTAYEPDAVVHCGEVLADDAVIVPAPMIVVEVLSPSTATPDTVAKLADYFRLASVCHCLIVRTDRPTVIHHRRGDGEVMRPGSSRPASCSSIRPASPSISPASAAEAGGACACAG